MPLPLITTNMYFDTVLKAIETTLKAEAANQVSLGGDGWETVRERFDPWNVTVDKLNPGVANVVWSNSNFPDEGNSFDQSSLSDFDIDCYASEIALKAAGVVTEPADQRTADVLHALITKVYYTIMSPIYYDLGLIAGTIARPWIKSIIKFIPSEANISIKDVIAAKISCSINFDEVPPPKTGVDLEIINVDTDTEDDGNVNQTFDVTATP